MSKTLNYPLLDRYITTSCLQLINHLSTDAERRSFLRPGTANNAITLANRIRKTWATSNASNFQEQNFKPTLKPTPTANVHTRCPPQFRTQLPNNTNARHALTNRHLQPLTITTLTISPHISTGSLTLRSWLIKFSSDLNSAPPTASSSEKVPFTFAILQAVYGFLCPRPLLVLLNS
jgi:hypothetical protein